MKDEEFNLIKQELIHEIKGMRSDMNRLFETTQFHDISLYGNKKDNTPGAMDDIRVLKEAKKIKDKHMAFVWSAVILSTIERAFHYVTGK